VKKRNPIELDFIIDDLTKSIRNTISGDSFQTDISNLTGTDLKQVSKKKGWRFNWEIELNDYAKEVYKLTIINNPEIIQGLVSFAIQSDHVLMTLLESAPFNIGKNKLYEGVAGNLVAFPCKISFQHGFRGYVAFTAKTKLIDHYEKTLGAYTISANRMIIPTQKATLLVEKYFNTQIKWDI
jgi:hypothetical protein